MASEEAPVLINVKVCITFNYFFLDLPLDLPLTAPPFLKPIEGPPEGIPPIPGGEAIGLAKARPGRLGAAPGAFNCGFRIPVGDRKAPICAGIVLS